MAYRRGERTPLALAGAMLEAEAYDNLRAIALAYAPKT